MSIYHMSMSNVSRAHGSSSCATLSYISGRAVREERTGQTYSYGRAERVVCTETMIPDYAPAAFSDPSNLFNAIESFETSENARTAKKICVALPREFDLQTSRQVIEDYIKRNFVDKGYCATYAIHYDKDGNNPHAHILIPNRQLAKDGSWNAKRKMTYQLDDRGNRVPLIDPKTGAQKVDSRGRKAWKRINAVANPLDDRQTLKQLRASWAEVCNARLQTEDHIDARSYADQGKEQIPTVHEGYAARAMAERGEVSERVELNKQIREANAELMRIAAARQTCYANLIVLQQEQAEAARAAARAAEERQRQEEAARAAARAAEEKRQQEQRRQDAVEEQYWIDYLGGMDAEQFDYFCNNNNNNEYRRRANDAEDKAACMWIKDHINEVNDHFAQYVAAEKRKIAPWLKENPKPYAPVPRQGNRLTRLFTDYWYKTSDYKEGDHIYHDKDYDAYRDHQQNLVDRWNCAYDKVREPLKRAQEEQQSIKRDIDNKDYKGIWLHVWGDSNSWPYKREHASLYHMIKEGARELIQTLREFAPVRAMLKVVNMLKDQRGEELQRMREQQREQQRQRSQGRGGYQR